MPRLTAFRPRHLIALIACILLYSTSTVPVSHLAFALLSLPYTLLLSKTSFPLSPASPPSPPILGYKNRTLLLYMVFAAVIGLLLPSAYIMDAILADDRDRVGAASPHLFLLCAQIVMEGVAFSESMAVPLQVVVPVLFNARRLPVIGEWIGWELARGGEGWRVVGGKVMAGLNMGLWYFNLFGFLVPVFLPRVFKRYYGKKDE